MNKARTNPTIPIRRIIVPINGKLIWIADSLIADCGLRIADFRTSIRNLKSRKWKTCVETQNFASLHQSAIRNFQNGFDVAEFQPVAVADYAPAAGIERHVV